MCYRGVFQICLKICCFNFPNALAKSLLILFPCPLFGSGYADRIHELLTVSSELSMHEHDTSSLERDMSKNFFSEGDCIKFTDVKVVTLLCCCLLFFLSPSVDSEMVKFSLCRLLHQQIMC